MQNAKIGPLENLPLYSMNMMIKCVTTKKVVQCSVSNSVMVDSTRTIKCHGWMGITFIMSIQTPYIIGCYQWSADEFPWRLRGSSESPPPSLPLPPLHRDLSPQEEVPSQSAVGGCGRQDCGADHTEAAGVWEGLPV